MQRQNLAYSLRALARDISISPSFLSAVMTGKRPFPKKRLKDFAKALRMDESAKNLLAQAVDNEFVEKAAISVSNMKSSERAIEKFSPLPDKSVSLLEQWYYVAILDLVVCEKGLMDAKRIAERLGIDILQAKNALRFLTEKKWLQVENGRYVKSEERIRVPTRNSREQVRNFHKQMIQLALQELLQNTDEKSFFFKTYQRYYFFRQILPT